MRAVRFLAAGLPLAAVLALVALPAASQEPADRMTPQVSEPQPVIPTVKVLIRKDSIVKDLTIKDFALQASPEFMERINNCLSAPMASPAPAGSEKWIPQLKADLSKTVPMPNMEVPICGFNGK